MCAHTQKNLRLSTLASGVSVYSTFMDQSFLLRVSLSLLHTHKHPPSLHSSLDPVPLQPVPLLSREALIGALGRCHQRNVSVRIYRAAGVGSL